MTNETFRFIQCGIGDETYGLDMSWVESIQRSDRLRWATSVEDSSSGLVGWLPGEGYDIPVFSLATGLDVETPPIRNDIMQRIIVLHPPRDSEGKLWALLVDRVSQVIHISLERLASLPPLIDNPCFESIIRDKETLILLLSPTWFYSTHVVTDEDINSVIPEHSLKTVLQADKVRTNGKDSVSHHRGYIVVFSPLHGLSEHLVCGLSISQIPEVLNPLPLISAPSSPPYVLGIANWRDRPVPIIDLKVRLGISSEVDPSTSERARLIIARGSSKGRFIGFPIEPGIRSLHLPIAHRPCTRTLPLNQRLVRGTIELEDETLVIPDIQALMRS
jgi:chemotaxis signal transduction protein